MNASQLIRDILATYQRLGWQLRRALLQPTTRAELDAEVLQETPVTDAEFDALWFSRPSHEGREAWELRLVAESPYALFETFAAEENEAARDEKRNEMELRMRGKRGIPDA